MRRRGPLRKIVDRRQSFHHSDDYPQGYVEETLVCGHTVKQGIHTPWSLKGERRRCSECVKQSKSPCSEGPMKLPKGHVVCELCRDIIPEKDSKRFVSSITWGSLSGTPNYGVCCTKHETTESGYPLGKYKRAYA